MLRHQAAVHRLGCLLSQRADRIRFQGRSQLRPQDKALAALQTIQKRQPQLLGSHSQTSLVLPAMAHMVSDTSRQPPWQRLRPKGQGA